MPGVERVDRPNLHIRALPEPDCRGRAAHAHADWVRAEHTAEIHRVLLDELDAQAVQAEQRGDTALFTP